MSSDPPGFEFAAPVGLPTAGGERNIVDVGAGFEFVAPVAKPAGAEHGGGFEFALPARRVAGPPPPRRRARAPPETEGTFWVIAVSEELDDAAGSLIAHGLVQLLWQLTREGVEREGGIGGGICGSLIYSVRRTALLDHPRNLPHDVDLARPVAGLQGLAAIRSCIVQGSGDTVSQFLVRERARCEHDLLLCSPSETTTLLAAGPVFRRFRCVPIYRRWADPSRLIVSLPKKVVLRNWRKSERNDAVDTDDDSSSSPVENGPDGPMLYLPPGYIEESRHPPRRRSRLTKAPKDPVRLIHALGVVRHLRSPKYFIAALDDTHEYLFQDDADVGPRLSDDDPARSTIRRALARADAVSLSVTRRMFQQWRADDVLKAINVYCDASPVVGVELQGMLIDVVLKNGEVNRMVLPGSTLAYGRTGTMSKGVGLLWAIWLIAGPTAGDVAWFCHNVRSLTTDFGVEMHLLDIPDIAEAMIRWAGGLPLHQARVWVKPDVRLFNRALRLAGWSHTMGGGDEGDRRENAAMAARLRQHACVGQVLQEWHVPQAYLPQAGSAARGG